MSNSELELICFEPGQYIFQENSDTNGAYVITHGTVEISKQKDNKKVVLITKKQGELFGEMSYIDKTIRSASAQALEKTTCYLLKEQFLKNELGKMHPFMQSIFKLMASNTRRMTNTQMEEFAEKADKHE